MWGTCTPLQLWPPGLGNSSPPLRYTWWPRYGPHARRRGQELVKKSSSSFSQEGLVFLQKFPETIRPLTQYYGFMSIS